MNKRMWIGCLCAALMLSACAKDEGKAAKAADKPAVKAADKAKAADEAKAADKPVAKAADKPAPAPTAADKAAGDHAGHDHAAHAGHDHAAHAGHDHGAAAPSDPAAPPPAAAMIAVTAEGAKLVPAVEKSRVPKGSWFCDMGTVHYARLAQGDGKCPVCKMKLKQM